MLEGFYTAASGMLVQQRTLNVLSNNMANVQTPGFKSERVVSTTFAQEMLIRREAAGDTVIGKGAPIRTIADVPTNFEEDLLDETERPFDAAILGEGFFNIDGGGTQYLTRNGNFDIDDDGFLVLRGVGQVLGEKGPLEVKDAYFTIDTDGTVRDSQDKSLGKLLITRPQNTSGVGGVDVYTSADGTERALMSKYANGLYTVINPEVNVPAQGIRVQQYALERSNIDLNREYTQMMEAQRTFQSCSAVLKIMDGLNEKTATQIASIG